jgi:hypothetical protein
MLQDYLWYVFNGFGDELTANFLVDRNAIIVLKSSSHRMPQFGGDDLGARS